mmetsp:Transcript_20225/g.30010  ORF Transcript_20225/g.30010 Transcript_20225/m.30010 type:complete len:208 (-) Transcript_20225:142-765(-)
MVSLSIHIKLAGVFFLHIYHNNFLGEVRETMSCNSSTRNHSTNRNHSKTSVLEFRQLHFLLFFRIFGEQTEGVETEVTRGTVVAVHVGEGWESAGLEEGDPTKDLNHTVGKSIMSLKHIGNGVERELFAWDTDEFRHNHTNGCQHGSSAVLQFGLTVPWEPFWGALSESNGVEVHRRAFCEWHGFRTLTSDHSTGEGLSNSALPFGG